MLSVFFYSHDPSFEWTHEYCCRLIYFFGHVKKDDKVFRCSLRIVVSFSTIKIYIKNVGLMYFPWKYAKVRRSNYPISDLEIIIE